MNPSPQQPASDSSTGSVIREQVLNEVQKQVALEMQTFYRQREALKTENLKLKSLLEQFVQSSQLRVQGQIGQSLQGTLGESQGSALLSQPEVRIGIPLALIRYRERVRTKALFDDLVMEGAWMTLSVIRAVLEGFWMFLLAF